MNRFVKLIVGLEALLLIPFFGKILSSEVKWTALDFAVMAILLGGLALGIELALRVLNTKLQQLAAIGVVVLAFLLLYIELAVGIFNSPLAGH